MCGGLGEHVPSEQACALDCCCCCFTGSSLLHMGFLWLQQERAALHCRAQTSHCSGFSHRELQVLGAWAPVVAAHRFSICGTRA